LENRAPEHTKGGKVVKRKKNRPSETALLVPELKREF